MALPNLVFSVASEYDGKGLGKARKDVNSFDKSVKSLGRTLGATLSAAAVVSFGKASVKAFLADDKAAATLTKTLGNLNLAFEDQRVRTYISNLEATSGVLDSQLRPAMQALLTTTGSVTKSQELLGLAIDVAAGSGENLVTVSQDIAQAFVGNTRGLRKYNLGLSQTELKTASFADLQERLTKQFGGQNAAALDTYAGKLSLIRVAYDNLQETVGKGLVDSFALLAGDGGIGKATNAIDDLGQAIADTVYGIALIVAEVKKLDAGLSGGVIGRLIAWSMKSSPYALLRGLSEQDRITPRPFATPMSISGQSTTNSLSATEKARLKAEQDAKKRAAELLAIQKKDLLTKKANLALSKAAAIFDIQKIQLAAALKGKISKEEELRLLALQAIENENGEKALDYAKKLFIEQGYNAKQLDSIFNNTASSLQEFLDGLAGMFDKINNNAQKTLETARAIAGSLFYSQGLSSYKQSEINSLTQGPTAPTTILGDTPLTVTPTIPQSALESFRQSEARYANASYSGGVTYNINATGIGDTQIAAVVQNALQELNRYGNSTTYAGAL